MVLFNYIHLFYLPLSLVALEILCSVPVLGFVLQRPLVVADNTYPVLRDYTDQSEASVDHLELSKYLLTAHPVQVRCLTNISGQRGCNYFFGDRTAFHAEFHVNVSV